MLMRKVFPCSNKSTELLYALTAPVKFLSPRVVSPDIESNLICCEISKWLLSKKETGDVYPVPGVGSSGSAPP